jgi:lactate dehydrogenase-like 2-hydroxyacid dehydrogenase
MKPDLLVAIDLAPRSLSQLEAHYTIHHAPTVAGRMEVARQSGHKIRAIVTNGTTIIPDALMDMLPQLGLICAQGVGYEGVDLPSARSRGIVVTHGPGTNANSVADHTMALMLGVMRDIPANDARVRAGKWRDGSSMCPTPTGKKLGLLGMGAIAQRIARRAAGFDMDIAYHSRREIPASGLTYIPSLLALAEWADVLVIAVPGGAATRHMVDAAVLAALGPDGYLVNIGRGTVVDTAALVAALRARTLAGAALDVIEGEPAVPEELRTLPNLVLSPHIGGRSPESTQATITLVLQNLEAFFAGRPVLTPVAA